MDLKEKRAELLEQAKALISTATSAEELERVKALKSEIDVIDGRLKAAADFDALTADVRDEPGKKSLTAKSLGEHFFATVGERFTAVKSMQGVTVSAPEYAKANTDVNAVGSSVPEFVTDVIRELVPAARRRLTIRDLLGSYNLSGNAVTYYEESAVEGDFATVAENGKKPQLHVSDPAKHTETLSKIAAYWKVTDEMIEDVPFLVSGINERLTYKLLLAEEEQLLNGDGTGSNIKGLLNRDLVQKLNGSAEKHVSDLIFKAMTLVSTGSNFTADAVVMNPADWEALRLNKDANGQYVAGGPFFGQYGQGGVTLEPSPWGITPVITPAIAKGTALVGAFHLGGQVAEKGGVRLDFTSSNEDDFIHNRALFRLEKRELLMVPTPTAFVSVTLPTGA